MACSTWRKIQFFDRHLTKPCCSEFPSVPSTPDLLLRFATDGQGTARAIQGALPQRAGRLESVHNAIEQGKLVAAAILGQSRPAEDCPWFWSDQYDLKLQIAGLSEGYDQLIVRGDPATRKFAIFYLKAGTLIAVDAVNSPPELLASKKLIIAGARIDPRVIADTSIPMKDIAAKAAA